MEDEVVFLLLSVSPIWTDLRKKINVLLKPESPGVVAALPLTQLLPLRGLPCHV